MKTYWIYILCSQKNGTLYIGITSNLSRRILEHKQNIIPGFSQKYKTHILVHAEQYHTFDHALIREKRLKRWNRSWKIQLIEQYNPQWLDLSSKILLESNE